MASFTQNEPPKVGHDIKVAGSISSEDAGFCFLLVSAIVFMIAALTGQLA